MRTKRGVSWFFFLRGIAIRKSEKDSANAIRLEKGIYVLTETTEMFEKIDQLYQTNIQFKRIRTEKLKMILNKIRKN
jgi:hypothetical protein